MTPERCPWCDGARARSGPAKDAAAYRVCLGCGSGFLRQVPMDPDRYYERYDPESVRALPEVVSRRYADILRDLEGRIRGRRLLEVGCGNGHFLETARGRGWEVCGTELSRTHVARTRDRGLECVHADLAATDALSGRVFDVVVAIEVVEHVPAPRALLRAAAERLTAAGWLYLTTPNYNSLTRRVVGARWSQLDREHVALATPAGLRAALRASGLTPVRVRSKNLYVGELRYRFVRRRPTDPHRNVAAAALRDRIEESRSLRLLKRAVNVGLDLTGLGEGLEGWARKEMS